MPEDVRGRAQVKLSLRVSHVAGHVARLTGTLANTMKTSSVAGLAVVGLALVGGIVVVTRRRGSSPGEKPADGPKSPVDDPIVAPAYAYLDLWPADARRALYDLQKELRLEPRIGGIAGVIGHESKGEPDVPHSKTGTPRGGLIQVTVGANLPGYTSSESVWGIRNQDRVTQLRGVVRDFYKRQMRFGPPEDQSAAAMLRRNYLPGLAGKPSSFVLGVREDYVDKSGKTVTSVGPGGEKSENSLSEGITLGKNYAANPGFDPSGRGWFTWEDVDRQAVKSEQAARARGWIRVSGARVVPGDPSLAGISCQNESELEDMWREAIARGDRPTERRHGHTCKKCGHRWWHDPDACKGDGATVESCTDAHVCSRCGEVQREVDLSICDKEPGYTPPKRELQDPQLGGLPGSNPDAPIRAETQSAQWEALESVHGSGGWTRIGSEEVVRGDRRLERVQCVLPGGRESVTYFSSPDPELGSFRDSFGQGFGMGIGYEAARLAVGVAVAGAAAAVAVGAGAYILAKKDGKRGKMDHVIGGASLDFDPFSKVEIGVAGYRVKLAGDVLRRGGVPVSMSFDDSVDASIRLGAIPPTRALSAAALAAAKAAGTAIVMPIVQSSDGAHPIGTALGDAQSAAFARMYPAPLPPDSAVLRYGGHKDMVLDPASQPDPITGKSSLRQDGPGSMVLYGGLRTDGRLWQCGNRSKHARGYGDYSQPFQPFFRDAIGPDGKPVDLLAVIAAGGPLGGPLAGWLVGRLGGLSGPGAGPLWG